MKLSTYVIQYLESITDTIFLLSGGGIMHLVDSVGRSKLYPVCCHHEQGAATAAEGYARIKNKPGVVLVTTGPGGTNTVTGVAGAWLDSIPMFVVSGQVKRPDITPYKYGVPTLRSYGIQELNNVDIVKPITKYAVTVTDPNSIRYHLEKAYYLATSGRPGPVWIDIPLDVQASEIETDQLSRFIPNDISFKEVKIPMDIVVTLLNKSKRPLLLVGNGVRLAGGEKILEKLLEKLQINTATVIFTADDLVRYDYPHYLGRQGIPGNKTANWAIDNCDLLLVIGDRLQFMNTSYAYEKFASQATKIMVDIDENELNKPSIQIDLPIKSDAKHFLNELYKQDITLNTWNVPVERINSKKFIGMPEYINIYRFQEVLSNFTKNYHIATSNGMASVTTHQALDIHKKQRFITNAGLGQMGSGLPLAIGACFASGKKPVICMEGDGSIMLNIQELQTAIYHKLPLKIFIFNNDGYFSIRTTHHNFFNKIFAADKDSGVSLPNFKNLITGWGIAFDQIKNEQDLRKLKYIMSYNKGPFVCELLIDPHQPVSPKWEAGQFRT